MLRPENKSINLGEKFLSRVKRFTSDDSFFAWPVVKIKPIMRADASPPTAKLLRDCKAINLSGIEAFFGHRGDQGTALGDIWSFTGLEGPGKE